MAFVAAEASHFGAPVAKAKTSLTAVERRAEELDTIAAVLPMERRDELAELLTDKDVETVPPASTFITGEKSSV